MSAPGLVPNGEFDSVSSRDASLRPAVFLAASCLRASGTTTMSRWLRFNFVGGMGIVVQFAALFLLKGFLCLNYLFATVIAVEAAVVHNFVWHEQFTWADRIASRAGSKLTASLVRFARFNLANGAVSILGNVLLMRALVGWGRLNYLVANAIAIALCSVANFVVSDQWVFGE
jgi:putative flippase GtrA